MGLLAGCWVVVETSWCDVKCAVVVVNVKVEVHEWERREDFGSDQLVVCQTTLLEADGSMRWRPVPDCLTKEGTIQPLH